MTEGVNTPPPWDGLNEKQRRFCEEYVIDLNGTQAAIRAGYSERTAESQASRLLRHAKVASYASFLIEERSKRTQVDADWVLKRLHAEATADLADIMDENGNLKPIHEWPEIWRQGLVQGIEQTIESVKGEDDDASLITKVKLAPRGVPQIQLIGRHIDVQAFKERIDLNVNAEHDEIMERAIQRREREARERGEG